MVSTQHTKTQFSNNTYNFFFFVSLFTRLLSSICRQRHYHCHHHQCNHFVLWWWYLCISRYLFAEFPGLNFKTTWKLARVATTFRYLMNCVQLAWTSIQTIWLNEIKLPDFYFSTKKKRNKTTRIPLDDCVTPTCLIYFMCLIVWVFDTIWKLLTTLSENIFLGRYDWCYNLDLWRF